MLDDYLKKESVLNVIGEIKNNPKYNGNSVSFRDSAFSSIEISLYSFYDALFKYKVIVDDDTLFDDFIEQVNKLYKKIDNFNDILLGINKLVGYMVIKHLKIKDINDPRQKKEVHPGFLFCLGKAASMYVPVQKSRKPFDCGILVNIRTTHTRRPYGRILYCDQKQRWQEEGSNLHGKRLGYPFHGA